MSELTYKKITDVEYVASLNNAATVFINDGGAMKQVAADKLSAVKTVNGIAPDENGSIVFDKPYKILFNDFREMGMGLKCNKTITELREALQNFVKHAVVCELSVSDFDTEVTTVYRSSEIVYYTDDQGVKIYTIHFGNNYAPIIVNDNTFTLDPDWVAPEANITESAVNTLVDTKIAELAAQELTLPMSNGTPNHGIAGQFAVSDGKGGIMWKTLVEAEEVAY